MRNPLATNIYKIRKEFNVTQKEFGEIFSVSKERIASYESGLCMPNLKFIKLFMKIVRISPNDMYDFIYDYNYIYKRSLL